jgi:hypothetical protein
MRQWEAKRRHRHPGHLHRQQGPRLHAAHAGAKVVSHVTHLGDTPHLDKLIGPVKVMIDAFRTASSMPFIWPTPASSTR